MSVNQIKMESCNNIQYEMIFKSLSMVAFNVYLQNAHIHLSRYATNYEK